jgi:outer membrane protein
MRRLLLAAALPLALLSAKAAQAQSKIGYVDIQRSINETDEGKAATAALRANVEEKRKSFDGKKANLQKMQADYEKQASVLSDSAKKQKQEELQKAIMEAQQAAQDAENEVRAKEQEAMANISKKMLATISQVAAAEKLDYVLDKSALLFGPPSSDITNEVIRAYNKAFPATVPAEPKKEGKKK